MQQLSCILLIIKDLDGLLVIVQQFQSGTIKQKVIILTSSTKNQTKALTVSASG
jgi:hypothetical protein